MAVPTRRQLAQVLVSQFIVSGKQGEFQHITPQQLGFSLLARIANPEKIDQTSASLCGPASLMYILAKYRPDAYVAYVISLYQKGEGRIGKSATQTTGGISVKPGRDCKAYNPGSKINPADWIALASLRDSENTFFDYDDVSDQVSGITMPSELKGWFKKAGFTSVTEETNLVFNKGKSNFENASKKVASGHAVCLFVDAQGLNPQNARGISWSGNHWVVLNKPINVSGDNFNMEVFTWGYLKRVPKSGNTSIDTFLDDYYGFISAKP